MIHRSYKDKNNTSYDCNYTILRLFSFDHRSTDTSKSNCSNGKPSIDIRMQLLRVVLTIWRLRRVLIRRMVENVRSQSAVAIGSVRQIVASLLKCGYIVDNDVSCLASITSTSFMVIDEL